MITHLIQEGEQIDYDWSLDRSYTLLVGKGNIEIGGTKNGSSNFISNGVTPGIYVVPDDHLLAVTANEDSTFITLFRLDYDDVMDQILPAETTSALNDIESTEFLDYEEFSGTSGNLTLTLDMVDTLLKAKYGV